MKDKAMGQPKLQLSDVTDKEGKGQLKPPTTPTNNEHQFYLDQMAIKDLKDGLNVMVDNEKEESILNGFKKCNQVFEVYKEKVWKLVDDHTKIGALGKNLKDLRLPQLVDTKPHQDYRGQGFPADYHDEDDWDGTPYRQPRRRSTSPAKII
jgi:hypothetical protein